MSCRKKITYGYFPQLGKVLNIFIFSHQHQNYKLSWGNPIWFWSKLLPCQTYFFIKNCLSHTFPRAVQSVTQTERVHLSLPIYALLFSPRLSPSCNTGMVDSCLLIQCHGLFPLSVCFDVSIQQDQWVSQRASVSRPASDINTQTPQGCWSFSGMSEQFWGDHHSNWTLLQDCLYEVIIQLINITLNVGANLAK